MPTFGGFGAWPLKFGARENRVKIIYDALNQARGTAYDTSDDSNVTAETYAEAVMLDVLWSINKRLSYQWDPVRMTDLVPRWEAIFDVHPSATDSDVARRAVLQAKFLALAGQLSLAETAEAIAGASFIGVEYTALADAVPRWPENGWPTRWTSNVAHIVIRVRFAPNQTMAEFWNMRAKMTQTLDDLLPAWVTFDIATFRPDGISTGFYLDERNLNYSTFAH